MTGYPRPGLATPAGRRHARRGRGGDGRDLPPSGAAAYTDQADAERVRSELVLSGRSSWTASSHEASQFPCAWNACCPWSAVYFVYRPVVIAGQSLTPIQQFAFDVSAEPMMEDGGGRFVRHLVLGPFHASSQVDYGDRPSGE